MYKNVKQKLYCNAFLAEKVVAVCTIADFAELCYNQFLSKNRCDTINDLPTSSEKFYPRLCARRKQSKFNF